MRISARAARYVLTKRAAYSPQGELDSILSQNYRKLIYGAFSRTNPPKESALDHIVGSIRAALSNVVQIRDVTETFHGEVLNWLKKQAVSLIKQKNAYEVFIFQNIALAVDWEAFFKCRPFMPASRRELSAYSSAAEINDAINTAEPLYLAAQAKVKVNKELASKTTEVLRDDNEWRIVVPHSKDAAMLEGADTHWCTSARGPNNMFEHYHDPDNKEFLYIFTNKATGEKYQAHYGSGQFTDAQDEPIDIKDAQLLHNALAQTNKLHPESLAAKVHSIEESADEDQPWNMLAEPRRLDDEGRLHSETSPAIVLTNGTRYWYLHGVPHRVGGPAIEARDHQEWLQHGKRHRIDGPALIYPGIRQYWVNGKNLSKEEFMAKYTVTE